MKNFSTKKMRKIMKTLGKKVAILSTNFDGKRSRAHAFLAIRAGRRAERYANFPQEIMRVPGKHVLGIFCRDIGRLAIFL